MVGIEWALVAAAGGVSRGCGPSAITGQVELASSGRLAIGSPKPAGGRQWRAPPAEFGMPSRPLKNVYPET